MNNQQNLRCPYCETILSVQLTRNPYFQCANCEGVFTHHASLVSEEPTVQQPHSSPPKENSPEVPVHSAAEPIFIGDPALPRRTGWRKMALGLLAAGALLFAVFKYADWRRVSQEQRIETYRWASYQAEPRFDDEHGQVVGLSTWPGSRPTAALQRLSRLSHRYPHVDSLDLTEAELTEHDINALSQLSNIRSLVLTRSNITDEMLAELLMANPRLRELDLKGTAITDASIANISELRSLRLLGLSETSVSDEGLLALSTLRLQRLYLGTTNVTDKGISALANMRSLEAVNLRRTHIGDDAMQYLSGAVNLKYLCLAETQVSDQGLRNLRLLDRLEGINLHNTRTTQRGIKYLQRHLDRLIVINQPMD